MDDASDEIRSCSQCADAFDVDFVEALLTGDIDLSTGSESDGEDAMLLTRAWVLFESMPSSVRWKVSTMELALLRVVQVIYLPAIEVALDGKHDREGQSDAAHH